MSTPDLWRTRKLEIRVDVCVSQMGLPPGDDRIGNVENELYVGQQKILFDREATAALYRQTIMVQSCRRLAQNRANPRLYGVASVFSRWIE